MSEPQTHWGGRALRGGFLTMVGGIAVMAGLIALFFWSPWERPSELDWVQSYEAWSERLEARLATDAGAVTRGSC